MILSITCTALLSGTSGEKYMQEQSQQESRDNSERIIKLESAMSNIDRNLIEIKLNIEKISKKIDENEAVNRSQYATKEDLSEIRTTLKDLSGNITKVVLFVITSVIAAVIGFITLK